MTRKEEEKLIKIFKALDKKIEDQHILNEQYENHNDGNLITRAANSGKVLGMIELKDYLDSMLKEEFGG